MMGQLRHNYLDEVMYILITNGSSPSRLELIVIIREIKLIELLGQVLWRDLSHPSSLALGYSLPLATF